MSNSIPIILIVLVVCVVVVGWALYHVRVGVVVIGSAAKPRDSANPRGVGNPSDASASV